MAEAEAENEAGAGAGAVPAWAAGITAAAGQLLPAEPLGRYTWFRVGGPAELLIRPADTAALAAVLQALPAEIPVTPIGIASNLLIRDGGIPGLVVRLGAPGFTAIGPGPEPHTLTIGAGAADITVARHAQKLGLAGLEFLVGIPGTIGGAVRMNAGAYGSALADVLVAADVLDRAGRLHRLEAAALGLGYRHSDLPPDWIVVAATLRGVPGDPATIAAAMAQIQASREASQPIRERTGGSTFANPQGERAWVLIDRAGCRGLRLGGAQVSEKHCNFLINTGEATAADLEALGETVRARVLADSGVTLRWEIARIGVGAAVPRR